MGAGLREFCCTESFENVGNCVMFDSSYLPALTAVIINVMAKLWIVKVRDFQVAWVFQVSEKVVFIKNHRYNPLVDILWVCKGKVKSGQHKYQQ